MEMWFLTRAKATGVMSGFRSKRAPGQSRSITVTTLSTPAEDESNVFRHEKGDYATGTTGGEGGRIVEFDVDNNLAEDDEERTRRGRTTRSSRGLTPGKRTTAGMRSRQDVGSDSTSGSTLSATGPATGRLDPLEQQHNLPPHQWQRICVGFISAAHARHRTVDGDKLAPARPRCHGFGSRIQPSIESALRASALSFLDAIKEPGGAGTRWRQPQAADGRGGLWTTSTGRTDPDALTVSP
ncbi:hypothetical protein AXG93_392s1300 [Marchantia polymorpha subsp. ruderalis]|uniref:Uncharacterized protein n=1 Tax=Marchantia polymorpha subsp. ruderalis TaxID=1480154 RepID=A0A176WSM9_MARPO|nr:hypothetical protein AXG93_392s1300 [Marchantia polymorpha subsp. ruderalis]